MSARYIIGIDLGTTNTAVAWLDTHTEDAEPQIFHVPQVTELGETDEMETLPSFVYLPDPPDINEGALDLPWAEARDYSVGQFARKNASTLPGKVISSSKSWLCANNVDRTSPILPWNRNNPERQLSPVAAARTILEHIRDAWNATFTDDDARFAEQEIILTVPASFDAVAREFTVKAAVEAGLNITLLEEPQAAFYSWLQTNADKWREIVMPDDLVLVCDIGGGTTDFSLIEVLDEEGEMSLRRVAVGKHILLGGDNMDLTLAYSVAQKLQQEQNMQLDQWQIAGLTHACREAKEKLLADPDAGPQTLTVLGRGSSVIGGTITTELNFEQVQTTLLDGFFPACRVSEKPQERQVSGLRTFGLDYAQDPAVTKHLASFLVEHCKEEMPTSILFNGGVSKANLLRNKVMNTLSSWIEGGNLDLLVNDQPDLAVALGACWYGNVRRGNAIRIKAGSPQSYYVGIESTMPAVPGFIPPVQALCVVPFGLEEGSSLDVPYSGLGLLVGASTEFKFFGSNKRPDDEAGTILPNADELEELPALAAELSAEDDATPPGTLVPVHLKTTLTEIGTIQVWCVEDGGEHSWRLEYQVRGLGEEGAGDEAQEDSDE